MSYSILTGIIITPDNPKYYNAKINYNLAIPKYPCKIVYCINERDVINAIRYARENNIKFRIRSGRHDFEANSNIDGGIVIDISKINYVNIDEENLTVTVGGGIVFGKIYSELIKKGYTTPGGTCADVGAAGLTTVGGVGYATRYLGLTLDNLIEVTLIDNRGNKLIVNNIGNSDLFWAIKGASASSFGVVTSLKYKIHKVDKVSFFVSTWYEQDYADIIDIFQNMAATTDNRLTLNMELNKDEEGKINLVVSGQFFGMPNELLNLLNPFFSVGEPNIFEVEYIPYEKAIEKWGDGCHTANKFKNSGAYIYDIISIESIKKIIEFVKNAPKGLVHYLEWISLGGEVLNTPNQSASFAHREAKFLIQIKSIWLTEDQAEASRKWTNLFKKYLDTIGVGNYRGFTDFNIVNWQEQYYRDNYTKLQLVKDMYDSENIFKYFQGIQPTRYSYK